MQRLRLIDMKNSRLPQVIGVCATETAAIAESVNASETQLLYAPESGDEGWFGTFAEVVFNISRTMPYFTFFRGVARLESVNVCTRPVPVQNQFWEYLQFGNGRLPKIHKCMGGNRPISVLSRNNVPLFTDLTSPPQFIRAYITDPSDVGKSLLLQGLDVNNNVIYSQVNGTVTGIYVQFTQPFAQVPIQMNQITGVQKDVTAGQVQLFQVDPNTGVQVLLLTMEPGETTAWYRRYYLDQLPCGCCPPAPNQPPGKCDTVQVSAIVKLDHIPVAVDSDYLVLQNKEAIIEKCSSIRYSQIDTPESKTMSNQHHKTAIGLLNGELAHFVGKDSPAVNFAPFGSARLERLNIGMI